MDGNKNNLGEAAKMLAMEGWDLAKTGETAAAISKYTQACRLNRLVPGWHEQLARLLHQQNDIEEAIYENAIAIELQESPPGSWYAHQGDLLAKVERFDEAILAYDLALQSGDAIANWYAKCAQLRYRLGSVAKSLENYKIAVQLDNSNPAWHAEIAFLSSLLNGDEVDPSGGTDIKARGEDWYNTVYELSDEYLQRYNESVYWDVWKKIIEFIQKGNFKNILEIGCGSGQLAQGIVEHVSKVEYFGIDFSSVAIEIARQNCPTAGFKVSDAFNMAVYSNAKFDLVVSTEVLEHIAFDTDLISLIPRGLSFIGTVPDFDSYSHVRYFKDVAAVRSRYATFFDEFHVNSVQLRMGRIFLFSGVRI